MPLSVTEWHDRFQVQSQWTKEARHYLYSKANIFDSHQILDVGCGTGILCKELNSFTSSRKIGIDIDIINLDFAKNHSPTTEFLVADAHQIPFSSNTFSCTYCHFLLLWVENPQQVISEMKRVTKPGGTLLVLAEPDYGGRIDYPQKFSILGDWQVDALLSQGANPFFGRQLSSLLHHSGLIEIQVGVIGAQWTEPPSEQSIQSEWGVIRSDVEALEDNSEVLDTMESLYKADLEAWERGERVLYVPTFYAIGKVVD
jgi:SAM-dependent methyltransferase